MKREGGRAVLFHDSRFTLVVDEGRVQGVSRVRRWEGLVQESGELGAGGSTLGKVGGDDVEDGGRGGAGGVGGVMTSTTRRKFVSPWA